MVKLALSLYLAVVSSKQSNQNLSLRKPYLLNKCYLCKTYLLPQAMVIRVSRSVAPVFSSRSHGLVGMKIALVGATGGTGIELVKVALEANHEVVAIVRNPEKLTIANDRLKVNNCLIVLTTSTRFNYFWKMFLAKGRRWGYIFRV